MGKALERRIRLAWSLLCLGALAVLALGGPTWLWVSLACAAVPLILSVQFLQWRRWRHAQEGRPPTPARVLAVAVLDEWGGVLGALFGAAALAVNASGGPGELAGLLLGAAVLLILAWHVVRLRRGWRNFQREWREDSSYPPDAP